MSTAVQPLSEARIAAYLRGALSEGERAAVEAAMDAEPYWLGVLALLAAELEPPPAEVGPHPLGHQTCPSRAGIRWNIA